jgi:hypothetical protein
MAHSAELQRKKSEQRMKAENPSLSYRLRCFHRISRRDQSHDEEIWFYSICSFFSDKYGSQTKKKCVHPIGVFSCSKGAKISCHSMFDGSFCIASNESNKLLPSAQ